MTKANSPSIPDSSCSPVTFEQITHADDGSGQPAPAMLWHFARPRRTVASAMVGGGIRDSSWVINAHVRADYGRMDPDRHLDEIARDAGLDPVTGVGLLTAARLENATSSEDGGVRCDATVGVSFPTWAAATASRSNGPGGAAGETETRWMPGTINLVCQIPAPLTDAALVGAVLTATEAKTQALLEFGVPGTGTASDAIVICCPRIGDISGDAAVFGGPRSLWGSRLARAVHRAVLDGLARYAAAG